MRPPATIRRQWQNARGYKLSIEDKMIAYFACSEAPAIFFTASRFVYIVEHSSYVVLIRPMVDLIASRSAAFCHGSPRLGLTQGRG
jgi:hypothetical protein